ncbi:adenosine deaminase [Leptospira ilyithenensis]|uniref:adenosine deaminase n=1 Tax=Leptospira ilyithenensis TaxID=2484901 RepID=A0A4V3JX62_9LEPT|nr:adenosine deaminase [Leptospira ilyithenensis]TGN11077.1 adenosine deaminase [Leptospira ilyithenensis]
MYCDLHNHLYGCLPAETLFRIGKENSSPRWHLYLDAFESAYGIKVNPKTFFDDYKDIEKFKKLYYFKEKSPFLHFQAKFNLIIALVQFHDKEITEVTKDIIVSHALNEVSYAEYRLMFAKEETKDVFFQKLMAACEGMIEGESLAKKNGFPMEAKLVMSIHRDLNFEKHYDWMKNWMEKESIIKDYLVGIDFCHIEEGFPPKDKKVFFENLLKDNKAENSTALSILYHVGESFRDKTPFSASRWVLESAKNGAHRLGHALAVGVAPDMFLSEERTESLSERLDQLELELENYDSIGEFGPYFSKKEIDKERKTLLNADPSHTVRMLMDSEKIQFLNTFQNYCLANIAKTNAIIESCPSSNHYIGMLENLSDHPIPRFYDHKIKLTIGSDDPGLFHTNLREEYDLALESGISEKSLEEIREQSFRYKSTLLSGRESVDLFPSSVN